MIRILIFIFMISNLQASRVWVERNPRFELESLIEIKCLDSSNCYLLSDNALNWRLYHSSNQGKTWNLMSEYEQFLKGEWVNARHLYLVNSKNIIIAFADRFLIMKSEDGGETFREISYGDLSEVFNSSRGIDMIDNIGIIATYDFFAYTNDNWETIDTIIRPSFGESYKLPGGNIYFIDSTQFICNRWANRSADFVVYDIEKKKWKQYSNILYEDPDSSHYARGMYDLEVVNDSLMFGCGGQRIGSSDWAKDLIWRSQDRGKTWEVVHEYFIDDGFGLDNISFENEQHGMAIGSWGTILETFDGGDSWDYINVPDEAYSSPFPNVEFIGSYPTITLASGIFRLENSSSNDEYLISDNVIQIRQTDDKLMISIDDDSFKEYDLTIVDLNGNPVKQERIRSGNGVLFKPYDISNLNSSTYLYSITSEGKMIKSGVFNVVK